MQRIGALADAIWNPWLLGLFLLTGLLYSIGSGFFQLFDARLWLRHTFGTLLEKKQRSKTGLTSFQALATALASTMGTGSIAGVATALTLGGAGAIFWMWICAFLGMMTGCAEKLLSVQFQRKTPEGAVQGGPMFYMHDGAGLHVLAVWFSLACIPATLVGGNLVQSSSIAGSLCAAFGCNRLVVGLITMLLAALVMLGGIGRIAAVSSALVPAMAVFYLGSAWFILVCRANEVPAAFALIVQSALSPAAGVGGGAGFSVTCAMRYGIARGVFTNEAGLGTSAMAHGAAVVEHPARQGMWGIFEVFLSTILVCTTTALVILVSGVYPAALSTGLSGVALANDAFAAVLGSFGEVVVAVSLLLFAFSSILGWSYYAQQSLRYLTNGNRLVGLYRLIFLACIPVGAVWEAAYIWQLLDLFNALMALPNLIALLILLPTALKTLNQWREQQNRRMR